MDNVAPANLQSPASPPPPWLAEDVFLPAPRNYGYRRLNEPKFCSFAELDAALRDDANRQIALVWTPLQPRLTPPEEVPFLAEALIEGERRRSWQMLRLGCIQVLLWGFLLVFALLGSRRSVPPTYLLYLLSFGLVPLVEHSVTLWRIRTGRWTPPAPVEGRFRAWLVMQHPRWSLVLLACLAVVGAVQFFTAVTNLFNREASSILAAGLIKPAVWDGELWRLLTGPLLHGNPIHFFFNAVALAVLGRLVEVLVSRGALAVTFVLAAVVGSLFSLVLLDAPSVGASGGVMGLLGFILVLGLRRRGQLPRSVLRTMAVVAALVAVTGLVAFRVIDNAAHAGGFIAGIGLGYLLIPAAGPIPVAAHATLRWAGWIALTSVILFSLIAVLAILQIFPLDASYQQG
jgi:membrane associated rhomboid family serine protease